MEWIQLCDCNSSEWDIHMRTINISLDINSLIFTHVSGVVRTVDKVVLEALYCEPATCISVIITTLPATTFFGDVTFGTNSLNFTNSCGVAT